jgi:hypothetical protein
MKLAQQNEIKALRTAEALKAVKLLLKGISKTIVF